MGWNPIHTLLIRVHFHDLRPISVTPNGGKEPQGWDYRIGIGMMGSGMGLWDYRGVLWDVRVGWWHYGMEPHPRTPDQRPFL